MQKGGVMTEPHLFQQNPGNPSWGAQADSRGIVLQACCSPQHKASTLLLMSVLCCGWCVRIHVKLSDLVFVLLCHHWSLQLHCWAWGENTAQDFNGDRTILGHKTILEWSKSGGCEQTLTSKFLFAISKIFLPSPVNRNSTTILQQTTQNQG